MTNRIGTLYGFCLCIPVDSVLIKAVQRSATNTTPNLITTVYEVLG